MGEFFKGFLEKAPDIIGKAAQSPLGVACLIVIVVGIVGAYLFRNATGNQQLVAFAMTIGGFLGFMALVFAFTGNSTKIDNSEPKLKISAEQTDHISPDKRDDIYTEVHKRLVQ